MKIQFIEYKRMKGVLKSSAKAFVTSSMHKSVYESSEFKTMDKRLFHDHFQQWLEILLEEAHVVVCCGEDAKQFLGYLVYNTKDDVGTLYYIYVKHLERKNGLANYMFNRFLGEYKKIRFCIKTRSWHQWRDTHQELPFELYYSKLLK